MSPPTPVLLARPISRRAKPPTGPGSESSKNDVQHNRRQRSSHPIESQGTYEIASGNTEEGQRIGPRVVRGHGPVVVDVEREDIQRFLR